jgi:uncharacterized protein (DUF4415 family)
VKVFAGRVATVTDNRFAYGEIRFSSAGWLNGRMVTVIWAWRGDARHIISMRYSHAREIKKLLKILTKRKPWVDPDDAPEWTDEMVARAEISEGNKIIRGGRPPLGEKAKGIVTMRLDADVLESYRALGAGWQTQINADLRRARKLKKA